MPHHYRILALALGVGLLLALAVILFIPEEIPGGNNFFSPQKTKSTTAAKSTDAELLKSIDTELNALDQEYNFTMQPASEDLQSPSFATDTEAFAQ